MPPSLRRLAVLPALLVASALGAQSDVPPSSATRALDDLARARALRTIARADSLLRLGRVSSAEALYYAAARRRPRDAAPRLALGRYLAARGASRIAAVLIEEARRFGANPLVAALDLAPLYTRLGDWRALRDLPGAPLSAGERERAAWLADRPSSVEGPDSVVVPLARPVSGRTLGAFVLHVGTDSVVVGIDPDARGLVLDEGRALAVGVRRFGAGARGARPAVGVLERASVGGLVLNNLPVTFSAPGDAGQARVGLDYLARFAPTARGGTLTLRRGTRLAVPAGERHPLLLDPSTGARIARPGGLVPLGDWLAQRGGVSAWSVDPRRGELVVGR